MNELAYYETKALCIVHREKYSPYIEGKWGALVCGVASFANKTQLSADKNVINVCC